MAAAGRPAAGRVVEVDLGRLTGWVRRFGERHGAVTVSRDDPAVLTLSAADGARADLTIPYVTSYPPSAPAGCGPAELVDHVRRPRTVGVLLVRRGGWAAGMVGNGVLIAAVTGGGYVQGKTKAGGWSQQRYARRRGHQAQAVWERAAEGAASVLTGADVALDALFAGGDRAGVAAVLADPRLAGLRELIEPRFFAVGDPKRSTLENVVARLRTVVVTLNELA